MRLNSSKDADVWIERWEDEDFVVLVRGKGIVHAGVFSKRDAEAYRDRLITEMAK